MSKLGDLLTGNAPGLRYATIARAYDPSVPRNIVFPISEHGLSSLPTDDPPGVYFAPRIKALPVFERALFSAGKLSGRSASNKTQLVAINADGGLDFFYPYAWAGRPLYLYVGGEGFAFSEYGLVTILVMEEPTFSDDALTIPLQDISTFLDREIQTRRYAGTGGAEGTGDLANRLKPDAWGCCRKVPPVYLGVDAATGRHRFGVGSGPIVGVLDVWDRGAPLLYAADPSNPQPGEYIVDVNTGTITLGGAFVGPIQADVLGRRYLGVPSPSTIAFDATTKNFAVTPGAAEQQISVGMRVRCLLAADPAGTWLDGIVTGTRPGNTILVIPLTGQSTGLAPLTSWIICPWGTVAGIMYAMADALGVDAASGLQDLGARVALNTLLPATAGTWVPQGGNGLQLLDLMAEGGGCYWYITRANTLRVGRIDPPSGSPDTAFDELTILSIERLSIAEPSYQVAVKCQRKWSTLATDQIAGVANAASFTEEWTTLLGIAPEVQNTYLSSKDYEVETVFDDYNAALNELGRQFNLFAYRRDYFKITQKTEMFSLALGMVVLVKHPRYGLANGKLLRIVDLKEDYDAGVVEMGLWG